MYALSTIARMVSEMRAFYRLAERSAQSPFSDVHIHVPNRPQAKPKKHPTNVEIALAEIVAHDAKHIRDLALLALVWHDHLTTGQLCQLNAEDIDLGAGVVQILVRQKPRALFLTRQSIPYLQRWLAVRGLYHPRTNALFISLHWTDGRSQPHQRLSPRGVFAIRAAYSRRLS